MVFQEGQNFLLSLEEIIAGEEEMGEFVDGHVGLCSFLKENFGSAGGGGEEVVGEVGHGLSE